MFVMHNVVYCKDLHSSSLYAQKLLIIKLSLKGKHSSLLCLTVSEDEEKKVLYNTSTWSLPNLSLECESQQSSTLM